MIRRFKDRLEEDMKDPEFRKAFEEEDLGYIDGGFYLRYLRKHRRRKIIGIILIIIGILGIILYGYLQI